MDHIFHFDNAVKHDPAVDSWIEQQPEVLGAIASHWFRVMRACGDDVQELLHDGHPTACVNNAAFGYVNVFSAHVNVGFFRGAELPDPKGLLQGTGKRMRHVKLIPDSQVDAEALRSLISAAYNDMGTRTR